VAVNPTSAEPTAFQPYAVSTAVSNTTTISTAVWSPTTPIIWRDTYQGADPSVIVKSSGAQAWSARYLKILLTNGAQYSYVSQVSVQVTACPPGAYISSTYCQACPAGALSSTIIHAHSL
jgi:hypothetical protein